MFEINWIKLKFKWIWFLKNEIKAHEIRFELEK